MKYKKLAALAYYGPSNIINKLIFTYKGILIGSGFQSKGFLFIRSKGVVVIGDDFRVNSSPSSNPIGGSERTSIQVLKGATLEILNNVGVSNISITCACRVKIGSGVRIGSGSAIFDTDFHSLDAYERVNRRYGVEESVNKSPVIIKDNVFIGARVIVLKGSCIGENSIIGASSVVSGNIPKNQIWAGNPARFIRNI
jgi:acetyltransferase-like isoleucine patch superfamily enzyme